MKRYEYEDKFFSIEVTMTGIICIVTALVSLFSIFSQTMTFVFEIVLIVSIYQIMNTFFTNSNPKVVEVSDEELILSSYGRKDVYRLDEINSFKVRQIGTEKFYVRINKSSVYKGRYWITTNRMNDGKELADWIKEFELKIHPDSLKAQAIKSSKLYKGKKED